jgi:CBS domain-containing protein
VGGALGALLAMAVSAMAPSWQVDPRIGALVGMAAMFAGASRALLASVVFAFETTQQPMGLLPLLGGCAAAYFVSCLGMRSSIMTEKLVRRGLRVTSEYAADYLDRIRVADRMTRDPMTLASHESIAEARARIENGGAGPTHVGFPVLDESGELVGLVTRWEIVRAEKSVKRVGELATEAPVVVHPEHTLREAADHMVTAGVGRLPVVASGSHRRLVGILSRSDLLAAHESRLTAARHRSEPRRIPGLRARREERDQTTDA